MSWTDERIETPEEDVGQAARPPARSPRSWAASRRNAVIGKAHRLGLKSRPSPVKANEDGEDKAKKKKDAA